MNRINFVSESHVGVLQDLRLISFEYFKITSIVDKNNIKRVLGQVLG